MCRKGISKQVTVLFYNLLTCKQQLSALNNVHYHANASCPNFLFPDFNENGVLVPENNIKNKLQPVHCYKKIWHCVIVFLFSTQLNLVLVICSFLPPMFSSSYVHY